ncbi:Lrp/AsnC family transcriptional regulator [uncultured Boseongicola sp.]|jgi:DNA-binding Lrp family transcriptional regulator|uniref:Lrp/AsnC family transcriptional regulator n=1 Tax=uncultured Boseongicola sp. TaxID=1648499 RepID=UPI002611C256|nr:Lrp/AsnC family transcriptional regulator [uncultured Boseongicola sp.]
MIKLDDIDLRILTALQSDAHVTADTLSTDLGLSASQIGRRRQRLEAARLIEGYRARLNPGALGLNVQAFVTVQMATHAPDKVQTFTRIVKLRPEITSAWTMTGDADYLLRVYCADLADLNTLIHQVLLPHPAVARVQSQIVMDQLKADGPLPI